MKKFLALLLAAIMALSLVACGKTETTTPEGGSGTTDTKPLKVGVILVGDANEGYSYAHIEGIKKAQQTLGLTDDQIVWKYSIPENETCYDTAVDLADQGCTLIFANSYSHQSYIQQAASEYPDITFVSMTGDTAKSSGLANFCNAFTNIYEARYVSGVVAGMKIAELEKDGKLTAANYDKDGNVKVGYVGAYPYAEVVSGYTAFYLGMKSVFEKVAMEVTYTNSWFSITAEAEAANAMISDGCVIIGQHADSTGAPSACESALKQGTTVYSVGYNVDMLSVAPTAALTSATNDWGVYYTYAIGQAQKGEKIDTNWAQGYADGAVAITKLGASCAEGTDAKVTEVEDAIKAGTLHVFDTSTFTCPAPQEGNTSYSIDADGHVTHAFATDTNGDFTPDADEAVTDGYYHESSFQSAPSFSLRINGITELS